MAGKSHRRYSLRIPNLFCVYCHTIRYTTIIKLLFLQIILATLIFLSYYKIPVLKKLPQKSFNPDQGQNNCWSTRRSFTQLFLSKDFMGVLELPSVHHTFVSTIRVHGSGALEITVALWVPTTE